MQLVLHVNVAGSVVAGELDARMFWFQVLAISVPSPAFFVMNWKNDAFVPDAIVNWRT